MDRLTEKKKRSSEKLSFLKYKYKSRCSADVKSLKICPDAVDSRSWSVMAVQQRGLELSDHIISI